MFERSPIGEHALLIQPFTGKAPDEGVLEEFVELASSAGATILSTHLARIDNPNPAILIGSGKLEEIKAIVDISEANLILINHALSPIQERNLEKILERRVVDRTSLILDIFAQRAHSHEGKLQVELAQLRHISSRLVRRWSHLDSLRGGSIGLRGPGEMQIELDRRMLQQRVEQLQKRLDKVDVQRTQMRRARLRNQIPRIALVGYTNAGKSTLFNTLTGANVDAIDQLFATLDPTVRRIDLPSGSVVLADTVGFVRDLPHELVAAFRSTLTEAREADLLLHLVDASDPLREQRIEQVDSVLQDIGAGDIPQLLVMNKIDRIEGASPRHDTSGQLRERVWLSAQQKTGIQLLQQALEGCLNRTRVQGEVHLPLDEGKLHAQLHQLDSVRSERIDETGWWLNLDLSIEDAKRLAVGAGQVLAPLLEQLPVEEW